MSFVNNPTLPSRSSGWFEARRPQDVVGQDLAGEPDVARPLPGLDGGEPGAVGLPPRYARRVRGQLAHGGRIPALLGRDRAISLSVQRKLSHQNNAIYSVWFIWDRWLAVGYENPWTL